MASKNYHYNLNTENCALLKQITEKINVSIQENDKVLGRLTTLVDAQLRLPNIGQITTEPVKSGKEKEKKNSDSVNNIKNSDKELVYEDSVNTSNDSLNSNTSEISILNVYAEDLPEEIPVDDYLRNHLDENLKLGSVPYDEEMFKHVQNSRIRQLLVDNYRLLLIKERKQAENQELWSVFQAYQRLLTEVIIPKLSLDVNGGNIEKITAAREACINQKFRLEDEVWQAYCKYIDHLEKVRLVSVKLASILEGHMENEQMQRLATQVNIVEDLIKHLKGGGLQRHHTIMKEVK